MINICMILLILCLHYIGDFLLQTDEMAKNKSKNHRILTKHVFAYTIPFFALAPFMKYWYIFLIINFILHWITDFITSRVNAKLYAEGKIHEFFCVIGFDQLIHVATLVITFKALV